MRMFLSREMKRAREQDHLQRDRLDTRSQLDYSNYDPEYQLPPTPPKSLFTQIRTVSPQPSIRNPRKTYDRKGREKIMYMDHGIMFINVESDLDMLKRARGTL